MEETGKNLKKWKFDIIKICEKNVSSIKDLTHSFETVIFKKKHV